jgi:hypothetical protein
MHIWKNGIQPLMILYSDVAAAGEQIRMSKLSVPHVRNIIVMNHGLIDQGLFFEIFNPTPFWNKAKPIIEGMRNGKSDSHYCENFESLNSKRLS